MSGTHSRAVTEEAKAESTEFVDARIIFTLCHPWRLFRFCKQHYQYQLFWCMHGQLWLAFLRFRINRNH